MSNSLLLEAGKAGESKDRALTVGIMFALPVELGKADRGKARVLTIGMVLALSVEIRDCCRK